MGSEALWDPGAVPPDQRFLTVVVITSITGITVIIEQHKKIRQKIDSSLSIFFTIFYYSYQCHQCCAISQLKIKKFSQK